MSFSFRQQKFVLDRSAALFRKMRYQTRGMFEQYGRASGLGTKAAADAAERAYGANQARPLPLGLGFRV